MLASLVAAPVLGQQGQAADASATDASGVIELDAKAAAIHGQTLRFMVLEGLGNLCYWSDQNDWASWEFQVERPGEYVVEMKYACQDDNEGSGFDLTLGETKLQGTVQGTGTWYDHVFLRLGNVTVDRAGGQTLTLKPTSKPGGAVMNLAWIRLISAADYDAYLKRTAKERQPVHTDLSQGIFIIPNFHPASCGWLADFSVERNYCGYSYLAHLDRAREDPTYAYAQSEINNLMAIIAFEPQRVEELKQRIQEGRAELVNAFFLEPTINLSGGEALVKMGVEGLRWQQQVMGVRPRCAWMIDVCGIHEQFAQIVSGLGLDAIVYIRGNMTGKAWHWFESPDGSRALGFNEGDAYADWGDVFNSTDALSEKTMKELLADAKGKARRTPVGLPIGVLGGYGDYSLPPARKQYPREFIAEWKQANPEVGVRFATMGQYLDAVLPAIRSGKVELPVSRRGAEFSWPSFWIANWPVKTRYRHAEHALQTAESASAVASLKTGFAYPVQGLYHAWLQMLLNMDRNTLWGAAAGKVFESRLSWDAKDRFDSVEAISAKAGQDAVGSILGKGKCLGLFNPLNWRRTDPVLIKLPAGTSVRGMTCQADTDGNTLCGLDLPSVSAAGLELESKSPAQPKVVPLPAEIETAAYVARVDPNSGSLVSLKVKPSGREILGGPIAMVSETGADEHFTESRPKRKRLADSNESKAEITVREGPLAIVVEARSTFQGGKLCRTMRFFKDRARIDFDYAYENIPDKTVVVAEFPLSADPREIRRGIPFGFSHAAGSVPDPELTGSAQGIQPAVRWSHYQMDGCGLAILDRGLSGRELNGRTPVLFLLNATDTYLGYPCSWLSGKGPQRGSFSLVAHEGDFKGARIPQMAWEYNCPPLVVEGVREMAPQSLVSTSENVIVEALRREGADIELRMAECFGMGGMATVRMELPHTKASITDLNGANPQEVPGGPEYRFPVRPQQIVTMRFLTEKPVEAVQPLLKWDELVPANKLEALRKRLPGCTGHPPRNPGGPFPTLPTDAGPSLTLGRKAKASSVHENVAVYDPDLALDGDESTRWATAGGTKAAWLEVDLGQPESIGRAFISEAYDRVRRFELQYEKDGQWRTFAQGLKIGLNLDIHFEPVTARRVRLNVQEAVDGPTIWEFHLYRP